MVSRIGLCCKKKIKHPNFVVVYMFSPITFGTCNSIINATIFVIIRIIVHNVNMHYTM